MSSVSETPAGAFSPLRHKVFAVLWVATVLGNIGTFMRDVASGWLVTELTTSATAVALIQAAATLPVFLLAIPAGVLSDILDRRRLLIFVQVLLAATSGALMLLAATASLSVTGLIALTFVGGMGYALMAPTWQAIVPELVPRPELRTSVALNSLGFNIARSIGPALGGAILAAFGAAVTYGIDVLTYVAVIAALLWWPRARSTFDPLAEHFGGALRAGLRHVRASRDLHVVLWRAALFFSSASCVWALLPLVSRNVLGGGPGFYGLLLGAAGAGAVLGALVMPPLRRRLDADGIVLAASLLAAASIACLAFAPPRWLAPLILVLLGASWISTLTTLNGTAQAVLPNWVRGRGLAVYLTVFNGALAIGSVAWGALAEAVGLRPALMAGGLCLAGAALIAARIRLPAGEADLTPSSHWPEPALAEPVADRSGPVLVTVEYRVNKDSRARFLRALRDLSEERRRDGAYSWGVTEDAANPEHLVEWFMIESWSEHLRQHRRVSAADAALQAEVQKFHRGDAPPIVRHLIGVTEDGR